MSTNDPVLEVLQGIRSELVGTRTELGRLVRHAEYTNMRLDEQGDLLREHGQILRSHDARLAGIDERFVSIERDMGATVVTLGLLHAGMRTIVPAIELGALRDHRLEARVAACERRLGVLEDDSGG